jgi:hypothetical protein
VVRRIDTRTGWLTTAAGDGVSGTRGSGGPATDAELAAGGGFQCGMAAAPDATGNLLIAAGAVHVVAARTGSFYGQQMLAGHIYTIPPDGFGGSDVRADPAGGRTVMINGYGLCSLLCFVGGCDPVGPEPRSIRWSARSEVSSCRSSPGRA